MTQKIARKRALELAMECIEDAMHKRYDRIYNPRPGNPSRDNQKDKDEYAELSAALAYIENLARQKELL